MRPSAQRIAQMGSDFGVPLARNREMLAFLALGIPAAT